ncbi:hypothetical protein JHK85_048176 [Glycine max]|nr:hypothetical protein JHK85_048176 [Glycine max]
MNNPHDWCFSQHRFPNKIANVMLSLSPIVKQKTKSEEANPVHTTIEDATTVRWSQLRNQIRHHKFQKLDFEEQPHHFQLKHDEASGLIEALPSPLVLVHDIARRGRGRGSYQSDAPRGRFNPRNFGRGHGEDGSDREYNKSKGSGRGRGSYQSDAPRGRFNPRKFGRGHGEDGSDREYKKSKRNGFY